MGQFIVALCVVALVFKYFWWLAAAVGLAWGVKALAHQVEVQRAAAAKLAAANAALAQRADQQHAWVYAGDPRGTFGEAFTNPA